MKLTLSDWGSIADVVSGIAVIITLIFLIVGIRENTDITRASVYANSMDSLNEMEGLFLQDPELIQIYRSYIQGDINETEGLERDRLSAIVTMQFRNYEKAFFNQRYELFGESEWSRFQRVICINRDNAEGAGLDGLLNAILTDEFQAFIESTCMQR